MRLAEFSPIAQRSASSRFDLPQPLGPTMPVRPGSMRKSDASTNDLKPERRSLRKCTGPPPGLSPPPLGGDRSVELSQSGVAGDPRAADNERGRRVHPVLLG